MIATKSKTERLLDLAAKVAGVVVIGFGVYEYFDDKAHERAVARNVQALSLIDSFATGRVYAARQLLNEFWSVQSDFVVAARDVGDLSTRAYRRFLIKNFLNKDGNTFRDSLFLVTHFFDQVYFCQDAGVCERSLITGFFCPHAISYSNAYAELYRYLQSELKYAPMDRGLSSLAKECRAIHNSKSSDNEKCVWNRGSVDYLACIYRSSAAIFQR